MLVSPLIRAGLVETENRVSNIEMFTVSVETQFQASHQLSLPDGLKEPLHRHNWSVTADVSSEVLNSMGLVMDFRRLAAMVDNIVAELDNTPLERIDHFRRNSSSAETIAKYIYEKLEPRLPKAVRLEAVKVVERPGCSARFSEGPKREKNVFGNPAK